MLIPFELEKEIQQCTQNNETPFFVAATCSATLLRANDPDEMAEICNKYNCWLHADGSFGGSLILSEQHKYLMKGIEQTDSSAWNPHKLMNIPLICSVILVKKCGILQHNITDINTNYIFHDIDKIEDLGKKSIQCERRVDAVKLWFAWKYFGLDGYQKRIDNLIAMASYAEEIVTKNHRLELLVNRQSFAICFRFIPEYKINLNDFNLELLREAMRKYGKSMVNYSYIGKTLAIRLVITNREFNKADIDLFFNNLFKTALKLENKSKLVTS